MTSSRPYDNLILSQTGLRPDTPGVSFSITELADALLSSYSRHGGINRLDGVNLPSKGAVVDITCDLLRLVFPGFFHDEVIHSSEIKAETVLRLDSVAGRLEDEIHKAIRCFPAGMQPRQDPRRTAHELAGDFLRQIGRAHV